MRPSDRLWLRGLALAAALSLALPASARPAHHRTHHRSVRHPGPVTAVRHFIDSFNRHDEQSGAADLQDHVDIVSQDLPRERRDADAVRAWLADLEHRDADGDGQPDDRVTLYRSSKSWRDAYVVAPVLYSYQSGGQVVVTPARMAIALRHETAGWRVTGWAWTGDGAGWTDR